MKKPIPTSVVVSGAVDAKNVAFAVHVSSVEEFVVAVAWFAAAGHVWSDVVEVAEAPGEGDVGCVV
jgi:hypothetical protein